MSLTFGWGGMRTLNVFLEFVLFSTLSTFWNAGLSRSQNWIHLIVRFLNDPIGFGCKYRKML